MEYLHKHKEEFINAVNLASEYFHILPVIVEKRLLRDYDFTRTDRKTRFCCKNGKVQASSSVSWIPDSKN